MKAPVELGQEIEVAITGYGHEGEGVGRYQNFTVFLPEALKDETVRARVCEVKKNFARAKLSQIVRPAAGRVQPPCQYYQECGGCQLQHLDYQGQLAMKRQKVVDSLERLGGLPEVTVHPVLGMPEPWYYRNKAQYPLGLAAGEAVAGFYRQGTHEIVPNTGCLIQHSTNNQILDKLLELIRRYRISIYNGQTGEGLLRHLLLKNGFATGEVMVVLVTNGESFPEGRRIAHDLAAQFPAVKSVVQNINCTRGNVILGATTRLLWGRDYILDELAGLKFKISPLSFFQVNPLQTAVLYNQAVAYAGLTGAETVLDAYCGVGSLTLFLARQAHRVYGIEVVAEAIANARENAALNSITNTHFFAGETERVLPQLLQDGVRFDVAVVDPPRSGCDPNVLKSFAQAEIGRIVYVSCNPSTLARDLKALRELGYETGEVQPVDMFPQTYHTECVAICRKK